MIADTNGIDLDIIRQSEWGIYDTQRVVATYCVRLADGRTAIRLKDGTEFVTAPNTVVRQYTGGGK